MDWKLRELWNPCIKASIPLSLERTSEVVVEGPCCIPYAIDMDPLLNLILIRSSPTIYSKLRPQASNHQLNKEKEGKES